MKSFFGFLGKPRAKNIAVIDISSASVGAAYATISGVAPPAMVFQTRIENRSETASTPGMLRALDAVARELSTKGVSRLRSVTGSASIDTAYVLMSAPWQTSKLSVKTIEKEKQFLFTEAMLAEALAEERKTSGTTSLIASVLNGYETPNPVGKRTTRAEIVLLSSAIDAEIEPYIKRAIRSFVGAAPLEFISFASASHLVLRGLFPHERDFLALRIGTEGSELAFIKHGHLAGIETAGAGTSLFAKAAREHGIVSPGGVSDTENGLIDKEKSQRLAERLAETERTWIGLMKETLVKIAAEGALPRVIFLFSDERTLPFFKRLLDAPELHALWLSDEPLTVIPVVPRQFFQFMRHINTDESDAVLDMLSMLSRVE